MAVKRKKRNYSKEYKDYHGTSEQRKRRASRNTANKKLKPGPGKEVHHKNLNPMDNRTKNLSIISKKRNRKIQPKTKGRK
tara:strand:+ start:113 stop:352 length:240 start_codon:yes stop_codon:yes gene_type:complete